MGIIIVRTLVIYLCVIMSMRIMGKRQIGELHPSELVTTIVLSNLASLPIETPDIPLIAGIAPILLIVGLEVILSLIELKHKGLSKLISGNPVIVIRDGVIDQKTLKSLRYSVEDLLEGLRSKSVFDISEVDFALVETSGKLSVYKKFEHRGTTAQMLGNTSSCPDAPPVPVVADGTLNEQSLSFCKKDRACIEQILNENHVQLEDIFVLFCDRSEKYTLIKKDD